MPAPNARSPETVLRRVVIDLATGCWNLQLKLSSDGYGRIKLRGRSIAAHRLSYELFVGPIPDGLTIDHLCRNRACCNPEHLEPVTHLVNVHRGDTVNARNAQKTHCVRGHPFDEANTLYKENGHRQCLTCSRAFHQRWWLEKGKIRERANSH